jgi:hypothetical protein
LLLAFASTVILGSDFDEEERKRRDSRRGR